MDKEKRADKIFVRIFILTIAILAVINVSAHYYYLSSKPESQNLIFAESICVSAIIAMIVLLISNKILNKKYNLKD